MTLKSRLPHHRRWIYAAAGAAGIAAVSIAALQLRPKSQPSDAAAAVQGAIPSWGDDLRAALTEARVAGDKDVLVEFAAPSDDALAAPTGPSALELPEFRRAIGKSFVLVRLAPSDGTSPARLSQISTAAERLGVARFPTFVLLDADGKPYARTDLVSTDANGFLREFERLRQVRVHRDVALADAQLASGVERARRLDEALTSVATYANAEYPDVVRDLLAADPDNIAGLRDKYAPAAAARQADAAIQGQVYPLIDQGNYPAAIARIDGIIDELKPPPSQLQLLLAFKGQLYFTLGDRQRAIETLNRAIDIDPQSESGHRARAARAQLLPGA